MQKDSNIKKANIGIIGVTGRMGRKVLKCALDEHFKIGFGSASENSSSLGFDLGSLIDSAPLNMYVEKNRLTAYEKADVLIDFSLPHATAENIMKALICEKPLLIGTTGLSNETLALIEKAKEHIPILISSNFSLGIHLCLQSLKIFSKNAKRIELIETHHKTKKDVPSGTALMLAKALNLNPSLIHSIRTDDAVGEHTLIFHMDGEKITLTHTALTRDLFALGALKAATFLLTQKPGLYNIALE